MENKTKDKKLWFTAKKYGWGWQPSSWQGWLVVLGYGIGIAIIALRAVRITEDANSASTFLWNYLPPLVILSFILILICYKTGEKPGWRWG